MHIGLITNYYYYYPLCSAEGLIVKNVVEELKRRGHTVVVFCFDKISYEKHLANETIVASSIDLPNQLSYLCKIQIVFIKNIIIKLFRILFHIKYLEIGLIGLGRVITLNLIKNIKKYVKKNNIDLLIGGVGPFESIYILNYLFEQKIINNYDLMLCDLYSDFQLVSINKEKIKIKKKDIEYRCIKNATKIFYIENWKKYFEKFSFTNAFPFAPSLVIKKENKKIKENNIILNGNKKVNIIYQGKIYERLRDPNTMINVISIIAKTDNNIALHLFMDSHNKGVFWKGVLGSCNALSKMVYTYSYCENDIAQEYMNNADIITIIGNNCKTMLPSKIYECVATCKPIIYFYYFEEELGYNEMKKYPLVYFYKQGDYSQSSINNLHNWMLENYKKRAKFEEIKKIYYYATPEYLVDMILSKNNI